MTLNERKERMKKMLGDLGIDNELYKERDAAIEKLTDQFFNEAGLGVDEQFVEIGVDEQIFDIEEARAAAKEVKGWAIWLGEEVEELYKDGEIKGQMIVSCRGVMYRAEMTVNGRGWEASNMDHMGAVNVWR